jgi:arylsulfatase A-like enzyme
LFEAARVVGADRLWVGSGEVLALAGAGLASGALLAFISALPLVALPARPLGRTRWGGFLWGLFVYGVGRLGVWWFTDPPPFTDPMPLQGSKAGFGVAVLALAGLGAALYQGVRGAGPVTTAGPAQAAIGGAAGLRGGSAPLAAESAPPPGAPNVLLVTLDTTRADHVGAYGAEIDTRAFDDVAAGGARFDAAMAVAPVTGPSHASMLAGAGPWDHQVLLNGVPLPEDRALLAEILHARGWQTAAFVSAYVLDGKLGFARGFDVYDDDFSFPRGAGRLLPIRLVRGPESDLERRGADTTDAALGWIASRQGPWFVWVHLFDAHGPYAPPPPYDTRYYQGDPHDPANTSMAQVKDVAPYLAASLEGVTDVGWVLGQYAGEVSYADSQLARLTAAAGPDALVAVIADHGESLGEHGVWFNHGDDVYETSVRVPFALRWPGHVVPGTVVAAPFEGDDLAPTLLALLGLPIPDSMTGRSAAPALVGEAGRSVARSLCYDRAANRAEREAGRIDKPRYRMAGLRAAASRYVQHELDGSSAFYVLDQDPSGLRDQSSAQSADAMNALRELASGLFAARTDRSAVDLSAQDRERLEKLGYMEQ